MKRTFKVFAPKWIYKLALTGFLICVLIPGLVCLIDDGSMVGTIVSAVLFSPFLVGALCGYRFRIIVCQDTITVRRGIGKGYSFHVNEITKVVRRVNRNYCTFIDSLTQSEYLQSTNAKAVREASRNERVNNMKAQENNVQSVIKDINLKE